MIDSKIDPKPGDTWLCRDGARARIYAADGEKDHSIHGAIFCPRDSDGTGGWRVEAWTSDGFFLRDKTASRRDLIRKYDWREELQPVWSVLNDEWQYLAEDADGFWWAFLVKPEMGASSFVGSRRVRLEVLKLPHPDLYWWQTLSGRPRS